LRCRGWIWIATVCLFAGLLLPGPVCSAGASQAETETGEEKAEPETSPLIEAAGRRSGADVKVYTNADLGPPLAQSPPPQTGDAAEKTSAGKGASKEKVESAAGTPEEKDALTLMFEQEAARKEHAQKISETERKIVELRQRVVDLEKRELAIKNPFLARPQPPEEGADEWDGASAPDRVAQTQAQIDAAKEAVAEAERELSALRSSAP
jgi:hypothetical protein